MQCPWQKTKALKKINRQTIVQKEFYNDCIKDKCPYYAYKTDYSTQELKQIGYCKRAK